MAVRILIAGGGTGGHLMPALALAQTIRNMRSDVEPVLVGAQRGIDADVLPRYPFRHYLLPLEPLHRAKWWRNARWPFLFWRLWRQVGRVLGNERPSVVVGTGGYAAGPVLWRAQRAKIPTVLQEQNAMPGVTTGLLAPRARQIFLGFPEARDHLRPGKTTEIYTFGNPIRPPPVDPETREEALGKFGLDPSRPAVLVFGGSQGSAALNRAVADALEQDLLENVNVLWGAGTAHARRYVGLERAGRVVVRAFLDPMAPAYQAAALVVCRAGAMTVAELCAWGKPSILVPLPTAAADHQTTNARALADAGGALVLKESELSGTTLDRLVRETLADSSRLDAMGAMAAQRGHPTAARDIVSKILTLIL